jgi:cytochrome P450
MTMAERRDVLRPAAGGLKGSLTGWLMGTVVPLGLRLHRALPWNPRLGKLVLVTRTDEVRSVFLNNAEFGVPYGTNLSVIMGGHPFFLGMDDDDEHRHDVEAMRKVVLASDIPARLVPRVQELGEKYVAEANGRIEVVDALVRRITFDLYSEYLGIPDPPGADLRVMATRLFEFQFVDTGDPALRAEVDAMAPQLRHHIQALMDVRRASTDAVDDVLGRSLAMQARQEPGFDDGHIRSALMGFIVGGPPQPPMVVPQALEQLLRRPDALAGAQAAARTGDDERLAGYVFEAMRFDPLAPFLPRVATRATTIAAGTPRAVAVAPGTKVLVAFSAAMMDPRRVTDPKTFNPHRPPHEYIHFGYGLHQCFGIHMNLALLPLMLKALLKRPDLRRAPGPEGHLTKRGAFADRLTVTYG